MASLVGIVATWNQKRWKGEITALLEDVKSFSRRVRIKQPKRVNTKDIDFWTNVQVNSNLC